MQCNTLGYVEHIVSRGGTTNTQTDLHTLWVSRAQHAPIKKHTARENTTYNACFITHG